MVYGVILFPSTYFALRAEKKSKEKGLSVRLIPVPRHLSSDCGVCLRIFWEQRETIESLLKEEGVRMEGVHPME
ncbi:MAG: DUF3343 domain-containing protein [Thermodesulfobacteriota bacterium]|nr:DUF3343 domain-containing protein [Thermodesulfobacteriota bacterium]